MAWYEMILLLMAGVTSGSGTFVLALYSGGNRTVIIQSTIGPLATLIYRWLAVTVYPEGVALSLSAFLGLLTVLLFWINRRAGYASQNHIASVPHEASTKEKET